MTQPTSSKRSGPALQILMGVRASTTLGPDLSQLLVLPAAAQERFGELLEGCLGPQLDDRAQTRMKRFGKEHQVDPEQLLPPVKACRFLLLSAARHNTGREAFLSDVRSLSSAESGDALPGVVMPLFDRFLPTLRQGVVFRSMAEHGVVVREMHWRQMLLQSSDHGMGIDLPLAMLTFHCQEGPTPRTITLQLLPEQIEQLRHMCDEILAG